LASDLIHIVRIESIF